MGAANLDDRHPGLGFGIQGLHKGIERRQQPGLKVLGRGDMNRCGKYIIGGLRPIDVVIRVHWAVAAEGGARSLRRQIADHLVDVHVGLGPASGLPDPQRELIVVLASGNCIGRRTDQFNLLRGQEPMLAVHRGAGALDPGQSLDDLERDSFVADCEVLKRALGLGSPESFGRHLNATQAVGFNPEWLRHQIFGAIK